MQVGKDCTRTGGSLRVALPKMGQNAQVEQGALGSRNNLIRAVAAATVRMSRPRGMLYSAFRILELVTATALRPDHSLQLLAPEGCPCSKEHNVWWLPLAASCMPSPNEFDAITLATAIVGALTGIFGSVTGIIALLRDRARLRLTRRLFDEHRLRAERPDLRQPGAVAHVPLDLSQRCFCLTVANIGSRPITIVEAHAAFGDSEAGLRYQWNSHWFRSLQTLDLYDRNVPCVLDETQPIAKFIYPADKHSTLLALTVRTPGRTHRYHPTLLARLKYRLRRRKWRKIQASLPPPP